MGFPYFSLERARGRRAVVPRPITLLARTNSMSDIEDDRVEFADWAPSGYAK